ncbi:hypothetical protein [Dermabacter hominis]|uniref:hypothetical protein n=1 Tax=Dermabacter hominis TaxID=36740 RepID=UPI000C75E438|nr:hypothetical protein CYJ49_009950 [Dermabacter hominis]
MSKTVTRRTAIGLLGASLPLVFLQPALADDSLTDEELKLIYQVIEEIDQDLTEKGTSVEAELQKIRPPAPEQTSRSVQPYKVTQEDILGSAVNSVIAAFTAGGYMLSAELLLRAKKKDSSAYRPRHGSRAKSSPVVARLRNSKAVSGSSIFALNSGGKYGVDLYYSIKRFDYKKKSPTDYNFTIHDVYDFDPKTKYKGVTNKVVAVMALAQKRGVIRPYPVVISV